MQRIACADQAFNPTLGSSRHEREWIFTYLGQLYNAEFITDVLRRVKGGKEANVYCCTSRTAQGEELLAAKLYRPRMFRNLRNDARYRQGRAVLDERGKMVRDERLLRPGGIPEAPPHSTIDYRIEKSS